MNLSVHDLNVHERRARQIAQAVLLEGQRARGSAENQYLSDPLDNTPARRK